MSSPFGKLFNMNLDELIEQQDRIQRLLSQGKGKDNPKLLETKEVLDTLIREIQESIDSGTSNFGLIFLASHQHLFKSELMENRRAYFDTAMVLAQALKEFLIASRLDQIYFRKKAEKSIDLITED